MDPSNTELDTLLDRWRREVFGNSGANPVPILCSIADLMERETEAYLKLPIDPFDDRHPSRAYPDCSLGILLKTLFKNENFMTELTSEYITSRSNFDLHVVSCRLLLDILPGLDSTVVFMESENLVKQLIDWVETAQFPLNSYATGLLAAAMEVGGISNIFREQNNRLVPLLFSRLHKLTFDSPDSTSKEDQNSVTSMDTSNNQALSKSNHSANMSKKTGSEVQLNCGSVKRPFDSLCEDDDTLDTGPSEKRSVHTNTLKSPIHNECSSSSWAEAYMSGSYQMNPLNTVMQQRFILQYLCAIGEYQELLVHFFEHRALNYILHFIDGRKNQDVRLAFDALKFLASILTHKKFALQFLEHGGLSHLLRVNRHGMASSGVSICLYYLAYNKDVMERICWMKRELVEKMVAYGLWLLECSHNSSRAHAAMFFSACFQFPLLLRIFDRDAGLRKLLNVIFMRGLFCDDTTLHELSDDEMFTRRHTAKQACIALKKYTRAHFISETRRHARANAQQPNDQECKPIIMSDEHFADAIELHRQQSVQRFDWSAIDKIAKEDGVLYLFKTIAYFWHRGLTSKSLTVRSALEVLVVCSLSPRTQRILLKMVIHSDFPSPIAMDFPVLGIVVHCADPKIEDADCKKSALNILINLAYKDHPARVPAPLSNTSFESNDLNQSRFSAPGSAKKRVPQRNSDLSAQLRKAIWDNNGTLILPKLLTITSPLTEADKIRSLACRVLCGLAKEESIRQIMSKLPLFIDGQLTTLMKEPILPEKRLEHMSFCKYCRELIELVTGKKIAAPFNAFRCPEATNRLIAPLNIASRILQRRVQPPSGGVNGAKYDRHYVYSKFRPIRLMRDNFDVSSSASCCSFSTDGQFCFVGTNHGALMAFNMSTGMIEASYECSDDEIAYVEASSDDNLILTTSPDSATPACYLWTFNEFFERKQRFDGDLHAEFGKASSDRIVSTHEMFSRLWDTATGTLVHKFEGLHRYTHNKATLNYTDTLLLNDGVLWDVRSSSIVHRFGKFNERINGIFHPNGNEVICNSHIWDVRNFRLLRTVPAFDNCQLKFNSAGDVIFSTVLDDPDDSPKFLNEFKTSFRTFDSHDYSTIATIDLEKMISHLAISSGDQYLAVVESSASRIHEDYSTEPLNVCRLYEVGRPKRHDIDLADDEDADDEDGEDDEDDEDDDDDDDDGGGFDDEEYDDYDTMYEETDESNDEEVVSPSDLSSSTGGSRMTHDELVPF